MRPEPRPRLWEGVLADLQARLANGEFTERFPTDRELMADYGVSRHTVREAVRHLAVVDRRPRVGGRVRTPPGPLEQLCATLRALGVQLILAAPSRGRRRSRRVADSLGADPAAPMHVWNQVLSADSEPLLASQLWLPDGSPLAVDDVGFLLGLRPAPESLEIVDESVLPAVPTRDARAALRLPDDTAVFRVDRVVTVGGRPVGWHRVLIRPERYRCVIRWDPSR